MYICRHSDMCPHSIRNNSILKRDGFPVIIALLDVDVRVTFVAKHSSVAGPAKLLNYRQWTFWEWHWNSLAIAFPRASALAILAARIRIALVAIAAVPAHFATAFAGFLAVAMLIAALLRTNRCCAVRPPRRNWETSIISIWKSGIADAMLHEHSRM